MPFVNAVLIVASSGRMLAQAAQAIGLKPLVIDCYADLDTQQYAESCYQITSLAKMQLIPAVEEVIRQYGVKWVIYGSGLEYYPESLDYLAERLILLGNDPVVFVGLLNKAAFFKRLDALAIAHPDVAFQAPDHSLNTWLIKPMRGQGGVGIKRYRSKSGLGQFKAAGSVYWQKYQPGAQQSVLFLADKGEVQVIGFNTQWTVDGGENQPFLFSGIMTGAVVSSKQAALMTAWLCKLVGAFNLKGLNCLDFIMSGKDIYVLEINPRPSASMQLYSATWLFKHIQACATDVVAAQVIFQDFVKPALTLLPGQGYSGYQLVYAQQTTRIPEQFTWPDWCRDLPKAGAIIGTTQPICSIIADDSGVRRLREKLHTRQQWLLYKLDQGV